MAWFIASLATAVVVARIWLRLGGDDLLERARRTPPLLGGPLEEFADTASHDLLHAGGYLVLGGLVATLQIAVRVRDPRFRGHVPAAMAASW